jgi:hypothetical protein
MPRRLCESAGERHEMGRGAGQAENHIKAWKNQLAATRTSCHEAEANSALEARGTDFGLVHRGRASTWHKQARPICLIF